MCPLRGRKESSPLIIKERSTLELNVHSHGGLLPRLQPTLDQQRLDAGIAAAEGAVHRGHVFGAAARKNHLAKALSVGARQPAVFPEPVERVVIDNFAPKVGIIAGGITAVPDM